MARQAAQKKLAATAPLLDPQRSLPEWERNMNPEQLQAIRHHTGPIAVLAQAGSGKTRALVHRLARMVNDGVDPARILAVTFSKKAADEMGERASVLGVKARIGTWHSLCLQVIKEDKLPEASWTVDESDRAKVVLKDVVGYKYMDWKGVDFQKLRSFIGDCKANLVNPEDPEALVRAKRFLTGAGEPQRAVRAFSLYNDQLAQRGLLTFDDFLVVVHRHLSVNGEAAERWGGKWEFLLQDEAQDANRAQVEIAKILAAVHRNYLVVGDPAQSIYGFRGSSPSFLLDFVKEWEATEVFMNRNYRSKPEIVEAANNVIRKGIVRLPLDMLPEVKGQGSAEVVCTEDLDDEAKHFVDFIRDSTETGTFDLSDITCLFRTNAQSRALEEALLSNAIPYVIVGGSSFYERKEVKDLLGYLRVAANRDPDGDAIKRSLNAPFRFLGARFLEKMIACAPKGAVSDWGPVAQQAARLAGMQARQTASATSWVQLIDTVRIFDRTKDGSQRPAAILNWLVTETGYIKYIEGEEGEDNLATSGASNVRELIRVAERFATVKDLLDYIEKTLKAAKEQRRDNSAGGQRVLLMSIHRSKGLEWPAVWVVGCNEDILPHRMGDPDEERRLMYVAMTRARECLRLSYVNTIATKAGMRDALPSSFLYDSGLLAEPTEPAFEPGSWTPQLRDSAE